MSVSLKELCKYENIVIQCHDNPDADAIASGYALWTYFMSQGKETKFVYGGRFAIQKSNLVLMVDTLKIPISYVKELDKPNLLITVDCQYGESNVTMFEADEIAVIDHHQVSRKLPAISEVRSNYGACSTIMWELLSKEGIDVDSNENLSTALYYGLMTDTNGFAEIHHPADKDLRDMAKYKPSYITLYRNSNISMGELKIAGDALNQAHFYDEHRYALVETKPCDPNILGVISDMVLEVDSIDTCLVYCIMEFGIKISVRSCVTTIQASELAGFIAEGFGGGGGHLIKAGGFLKRDLLENSNIEYTEECLRGFLKERMNKYFTESEILFAGKHKEKLEELKMYVKKPVSVGFIPSDMIAKENTKITIRTLEGDIDTCISSDMYIVIGIQGEIYPTKRDKFEKGYQYSDDEYVFPGEYAPTVTDVNTGDRIEILQFAKSCVANGGATIYARKLDHRVKVFTAWDPDKYYLGKPGDFLAVRTDDTSDIYIIAKNIFELTYELV